MALVGGFGQTMETPHPHARNRCSLHLSPAAGLEIYVATWLLEGPSVASTACSHSATRTHCGLRRLPKDVRFIRFAHDGGFYWLAQRESGEVWRTPKSETNPEVGRAGEGSGLLPCSMRSNTTQRTTFTLSTTLTEFAFEHTM